MNNSVKKNVIAFMNMKGGVGKTTLCVNLADCLAQHFGLKVLIIDMDPQFNATQYLVNQQFYLNEIFEKDKTVRSIFKIKEIDSNVLVGAESCEDEMINCHIHSISEKLDLICGSLKMTELDGKSSKLEKRLRKYITQQNLKSIYDFIFIDCPPTQSVYTTATYYASDYYILPVKPDFFSKLGINLFQRTIREMSDGEHKMECLGMVFTLVQEYPYVKQKISELEQKYPFYKFEHKMKQSTEVLSNAEKQMTIYNTSHRSDLIKLTKEFIDKYQEATGEEVVKNGKSI